MQWQCLFLLFIRFYILDISFCVLCCSFFLNRYNGLSSGRNEKQRNEVNAMSILSTIHLTKQYGQEPNIVRALDDVSISIEQGEFPLNRVNLSLSSAHLAAENLRCSICWVD